MTDTKDLAAETKGFVTDPEGLAAETNRSEIDPEGLGDPPEGLETEPEGAVYGQEQVPVDLPKGYRPTEPPEKRERAEERKDRKKQIRLSEKQMWLTKKQMWLTGLAIVLMVLTREEIDQVRARLFAFLSSLWG